MSAPQLLGRRVQGCIPVPALPVPARLRSSLTMEPFGPSISRATSGVISKSWGHGVAASYHDLNVVYREICLRNSSSVHGRVLGVLPYHWIMHADALTYSLSIPIPALFAAVDTPSIDNSLSPTRTPRNDRIANQSPGLGKGKRKYSEGMTKKSAAHQLARLGHLRASAPLRCRHWPAVTHVKSRYSFSALKLTVDNGYVCRVMNCKPTPQGSLALTSSSGGGESGSGVWPARVCDQ